MKKIKPGRKAKEFWDRLKSLNREGEKVLTYTVTLVKMPDECGEISQHNFC